MIINESNINKDLLNRFKAYCKAAKNDIQIIDDLPEVFVTNISDNRFSDIVKSFLNSNKNVTIDYESRPSSNVINVIKYK